MNKRGQFYIIAAIIIIAAIFGIVAVTNYATTKPDSIRSVELSKELNLESEQIINYGVFNKLNLDDLLSNFTIEYGPYLGGDSDVYFIYGDNNEIHYYIYSSSSTGSIGLSGIGNVPIEGRILIKNTTKISGEVLSVDVGNKKYEFKLNEGQNFFFVLTEPTG